MAKEKKQLPSKEEILEYLNNGNPFRKKEMAEKLNVPKNCRADFRRFLQAMEKNNEIPETTTKNKTSPKRLIKDVDIFIVSDMTDDGELLCIPETFTGDKMPEIYVQGTPAPQIGDKVLGRITQQQENLYSCKIIKILVDNDKTIIGFLQKCNGGFNLISSDRKDRNSYFVNSTDATNCNDNDMVIASPIRGKTRLQKNAIVTKRIGSINDAKCFSLLAIAKYDIPNEFPNEVIKETEKMTVPKLEKRTDLRNIPLVTIDGADARDYDDAVYAEKTDNGYKLLVAIADVAHYVKNDSELDKQALKRGNSVYFPDRVVPMLPEKLSNGLCSLVPNEERATMAVWIEIDEKGEITDYNFVRGLMKSHARLTYEQAQSAYEGNLCDTTTPVKEQINNLFGAYKLLAKARKKRNTLELDIPENQVIMDENSRVIDILPRVRLDSHKMIEEFMISANVCSALALQDKKETHIMYRIHDIPPQEKLETLNSALAEFNIKVPMDGGIRPSHFSNILDSAKKSEHSQFISDIVLRSQSQALYSPENLGHFGLALKNYCHFTSPIRRYSDLLVHRALVGELSKQQRDEFEIIADKISNTERTAQKAERETMDKYLSVFMENEVGSKFTGKISGVNNFAMFVRLIDTGAEGVIFLKNIRGDFYIHDEKTHSVIGRRSGKKYRMGDVINVKLEQVAPIKGGLEFSLITERSEKPHRQRRNDKPKNKKFDKSGKDKKRTRRK